MGEKNNPENPDSESSKDKQTRGRPRVEEKGKSGANKRKPLTQRRSPRSTGAEAAGVDARAAQKEARSKAQQKFRERDSPDFGGSEDGLGCSFELDQEARDLPQLSPIRKSKSTEDSNTPTTSTYIECDSEVFFSPGVPSNQLALERSDKVVPTDQDQNIPAHEEEDSTDTMDIGTGAAHTGVAPGPRSPGLSESALVRILDSKLRNLARTADVEKVMDKVDQNAANNTRMEFRLRELETRINDNNLASEARLREVIKKVMEEQRAPSVASSMSLEENSVSSRGNSPVRTGTSRRGDGRRKEHMEAYDRARRSVRIWPIYAEDDDLLWDSLRSFLTDALGFSGEEVEELGVVDIKRMKQAQRGPVYDEICATCSSTRSRDEIMSRGFRLSKYMDDQRKPTAGMRMDVPPHLATNFRALREAAFEIRTLHGKGTRTYTKFDDLNMDLYLEVRTEGSRSWTRIDPDLAREMKRESGRDEVRRLWRRTPVGGAAQAVALEKSVVATGGNAAPIRMNTRDDRTARTADDAVRRGKGFGVPPTLPLPQNVRGGNTTPSESDRSPPEDPEERMDVGDRAAPSWNPRPRAGGRRGE